MRPPGARFLKDTVVVHAPGTDVDAQGTYDPNTPGAAGDPIACAVQEVQRGMGTSYEPGTDPHGVAQYEILFAADPSVSKAEQSIEWTANAAGAISPAIVLRTAGAARPPHGLGTRWTVSATRTL